MKWHLMLQTPEAAKSNRRSTVSNSYGRHLPCGTHVGSNHSPDVPGVTTALGAREAERAPRTTARLPQNPPARFIKNKPAPRRPEASPTSLCQSSGQTLSTPDGWVSSSRADRRKKKEQLTFFSCLHLLFGPARAFIHLQRSWKEEGKKSTQQTQRAQRCSNTQSPSSARFPRGTTERCAEQTYFCREGCRDGGSQGFSTHSNPCTASPQDASQ